jgi:hypothetical protein
MVRPEERLEPADAVSEAGRSDTALAGSFISPMDATSMRSV